MKKLSISNRFVRDIASDWNELSFGELLQFTTLIAQKLPLIETKTKLFIILSGLTKLSKPSLILDGENWHWFSINKQNILISDTQINWAANQVLGFFKSDDGENYYPYSRLTRNIFPVLHANKLKLTGPSDGLSNITYKEFMHADDLHYKYSKSGNERDLDKLIAVLFRPFDKEMKVSSPKYKGDLRIQFNDFQIDYYADFTACLNPEIKQAILFFYEGCKKLIAQMFPYVFVKGNSTGGEIDVTMNMISIVDAITNHNPRETEINLDESAYMVLSSINNLMAKRAKQDE